MNRITHIDDCKNDFEKDALQMVQGIAERLDDMFYDEMDEFFNDALDIDYIVNSNKEYQSVRAWIGVGGPAIYVDTEDASVKLNWGSTYTQAFISYSTRDNIDAYFNEVYSW